jgi:hypothetical protein
MRMLKLVSGSILAALTLAACSEIGPTVPGSDLDEAALTRAGAACRISDDAVTKVRTLYGSCSNNAVLVPAGWTVQAGGGSGSNEVIATSVTPIPNPDGAYVDATDLIDLSGVADFTTHTSISDGTQTVSFSVTLEKRSVPGSWGTWADPPFVEPGTPHILFTQGAQTLELTLSVPSTIFGFELGPNPFAFHDFTAEYYSGAELIGTLTREISGENGARLMAVMSDGPAITRVVVNGTADFSIARVRYATGEFVPPIEVDIHSVYSGLPPRAPGIVNLADDYVFVEILDIEQYIPRMASASDVRIGNSFSTGTPAEAFEILDINQDGNRDIRIRWSLQELVDDGHLNPQTQRIQVWGLDPSDDQSYYGVAEIEVVVGDVVIDQNQPSAAVYMAGFSQTDLAQSFQTQQTQPTAGAGIFLQPGIGGTDIVRISLWDGLPNAGGTMLAQGQTTGTQGQWVDVLWAPVALTPNTTYYLVFDGNLTLGIAGDVNNPYPFGQVYANPGFQPFPNFDYTFRTWVAAPDGAVVPAAPTTAVGARPASRGACAATATGCR